LKPLIGKFHEMPSFLFLPESITMRILALLCTLNSFALADVMIENFDDAYKGQTTMGWNLGATAKAGYWYGYDDWNHGKAGLGTIGTPDVVHTDTNFLAAIPADCGDGSPCLHVKYVGGAGYAYPFSGVGFNFLSEGKDVDLSTMTSISFRAKGKGSFRFKLLTKHITDDFDSKNYWADMGKTFKLTSAWKTYTIDTADILPQDGAPLADTVTWEQCMDHVRKIHLATSPAFKAHDTLDLWIDDIAMQGVTPAVFGGTWTELPSGISGRNPSSPFPVRHVDDHLVWNRTDLAEIALVGARGDIAIRCDGARQSLPLTNLSNGAWIVRITTRSGEVHQRIITWIR